MDVTTKRAIKKTTLALRKLLEREDIPAVLKQHGIFPDGRRVPVEKLSILDDNGRKRRVRLEAIINREVHAVGGDQKRGVERYCREVSFTYLNRLVALRCMEVRGLIDECIKIRGDYAGRSLRHHRFLREHSGNQFDPEDTDSLKAFIRAVFRELQDDIKILFDPDDEYSIIMPSTQALSECIRALNDDIPEDAFRAPELLGWVYQYFQTEEKDRVFEEVRTKKKKIEGDDIIPATSLYTERYMVDYLVQNSLGAFWMEMYPDSKLCENWPYFVKDQDLKPREPRPVKSLIFLDPACGSGHFLLVAFDLFAQLYEEEARLAAEGKIGKEWVVPREKIATTILEFNLHGIDIDLRSVQLSYLALYLRMRQYQGLAGVAKSLPEKVSLVAADASLINTPEFLSWCEERFKEEPYALNIIKGIVGRIRNLSEIGSLARPEEDLKELIHREKERLLSSWKKEKAPQQALLFREMLTSEQQELPFEKITDDQFWEGVLSRVTKALDEYYRQATEDGDTRAQVFAHEANRGFNFLELCNKRFDVVATNPPYLGYRNAGNTLQKLLKTFGRMKQDLYAAFIAKGIEWVNAEGILAYITQQSWMFLPSFKALREYILDVSSITIIAHLGPGAFQEISGEVVNVALLITHKNRPPSDHKMIFIRAVEAKSSSHKAEFLRSPNPKGVFAHTQRRIKTLPDAVVAYTLVDDLFEIGVNNPRLKDVAEVRVGIQTGDDKRFTRYSWECPPNSSLWRPYTKGGGYRKWAGFDIHSVAWGNNGEIMKAHAGKLYGGSHWSRILKNTQYFFREALTYSMAGAGMISVRYIRETHAFGQQGSAVFPTKADIFCLAGVINSRVATFFIRSLITESNK